MIYTESETSSGVKGPTQPHSKVVSKGDDIGGVFEYSALGPSEVIPLETAAREFQIMVKTVGAICNLDCHYCYYLKKEELYPKGSNFRLDDETLERYIMQHIQATPRRNR